MGASLSFSILICLNVRGVYRDFGRILVISCAENLLMLLTTLH